VSVSGTAGKRKCRLLFLRARKFRFSLLVSEKPHFLSGLFDCFIGGRDFAVNNTQGVIPMKVKDLMRTHVVTLHSMDMLGVAEDIMNMGRIRHLPVVDADNRVVGIVTQRDLYRAAISSVLGFDREKEHEWLGKVKVQDVMTRTVTMIGSEAGVVEAVDKMVTEKIGSLPVVNEQGKLVGLLTETDCLRCFRDLLKMGTFKEWLS
jgi:CBS domain-containing protein